jgi:hypothetical protein
VFAADHLALAMGVSRRSAELRLGEAVELDTRLPRTLAALAVGVLGMPAVRVMITETQLLDAAGAGEAEARVLDTLGGTSLPGLGRLTPDQIRALPVDDVEWVAGTVRRWARRAVTQLDADAVRKRAEQATTTRCIQLSPSGAGDGMAWLTALLPEERALAAYGRVCDLAEHATDPGDPRTLQQARADVFADLLLGVPPTRLAQLAPDDDPGPEDAGGGGAGLVPWTAAGVPVNLTVLIDAAGVAQTGRYGPISPRTVRNLLDLSARSGGRVNVTVQEPVTCPGEHPDGGQGDPYQPPAGTRRTVQLRDTVCVYPGCAHPATSCDLDHTLPWPHGPTCPCNLAALCRHHHRLKHLDPGWALTNHGDGHLTWITPWGTAYDVTP